MGGRIAVVIRYNSSMPHMMRPKASAMMTPKMKGLIGRWHDLLDMPTLWDGVRHHKKASHSMGL